MALATQQRAPSRTEDTGEQSSTQVAAATESSGSNQDMQAAMRERDEGLLVVQEIDMIRQGVFGGVTAFASLRDQLSGSAPITMLGTDILMQVRALHDSMALIDQQVVLAHHNTLLTSTDTAQLGVARQGLETIRDQVRDVAAQARALKAALPGTSDAQGSLIEAFEQQAGALRESSAGQTQRDILLAGAQQLVAMKDKLAGSEVQATVNSAVTILNTLLPLAGAPGAAAALLFKHLNLYRNLMVHVHAAAAPDGGIGVAKRISDLQMAGDALDTAPVEASMDDHDTFRAQLESLQPQILALVEQVQAQAPDPRQDFARRTVLASADVGPIEGLTNLGITLHRLIGSRQSIERLEGYLQELNSSYTDIKSELKAEMGVYDALTATIR
jgi:hypothetical protein